MFLYFEVVDSVNDRREKIHIAQGQATGSICISTELRAIRHTLILSDHHTAKDGKEDTVRSQRRVLISKD